MTGKKVTLAIGVVWLFIYSTADETKDYALLSFNVAHANPQSSIKDNSENKALPSVITTSQEKQPSQTTANPTKDKLLVMKEWLKDVPSKDRIEFLGSLLLNNGRVASISIRPLKRTLSRERVNEIIESFNSNNEEDSPQNIITQPKFIKLAELLKDVPADVRNGFLDRMTFKNGALVSVYIGGLKKTIKKDKLKEIIEALAPSGVKFSKIPSKALCGNGVCYYAICHGDGDSVGCIDDEVSACYSWCKK